MQELKLRKGPWAEEEDEQLAAAVAILGGRKWDALAKSSGLRRSGKSCRLRWMNYLRPDLKHGNITAEEEHLILELHEKWGNKWSKIAQRLPGRTDNEIKNYWRSNLKKKVLVLEKSNNSLSSECDTACPTSMDGESLLFNDGILGSSIESCDVPQSPYENRLIEWMSNCTPDITKIEHEDESWKFDYYHSEWISEDCTTNIWEFPLWDGE
ncbi:hypothetical protein BUALT_Bualt11G0106900 [Buddleja alternifolia]|uniref:Uncharacterized protein n=1 Tax=Buddleja alternifolia TaxID=168488 RepID=A0AAV6X1B5_9LAMI|nr:hypothetical protein BUALT_Bualt11G0106900 [Buddleja alternifolia]